MPQISADTLDLVPCIQTPFRKFQPARGSVTLGFLLALLTPRMNVIPIEFLYFANDNAVLRSVAWLVMVVADSSPLIISASGASGIRTLPA
jgi:hypothetical protein